jgi:histidinol-phosphate aminotransferase
VLRTFSKVGLAGLRLGYLVAQPALVAELNKVRLPYNTPATTQAAALAVLEDAAFLGEQAGRLAAELDRLLAALREVL